MRGNYEAHYNLAWMDAREQRLTDAVHHLQAAIKARPQDAAARNALGGLYLRTSKLTEAEVELREQHHLDLTFWLTIIWVWAPRILRGDNQAAAAFFRRALTAQPYFRPAQEALATSQKKQQYFRCDDIFHDDSTHVRKPEIPTAIAICQASMIKSQQMQNRRMRSWTWTGFSTARYPKSSVAP